jgi:hypothetical protein
MRFLLVGLVLIPTLAILSCDAGKPCRTICDSPPDGEIILFDDFKDMPLITDPATIGDVRIEGDIIYLSVGFSGCTRDHDFALYGLTGFMESYPVQAAVYLSHDGKGEVCDAYFIKELRFDLTPLRCEYQRSYGPHGPVRLRLYAPGARDLVEPLPVYNF